MLMLLDWLFRIRLLTEEAQGDAGESVGLCEHCGTGLHQDVLLGVVGGFHCYVNVLDSAIGSLKVCLLYTSPSPRD